MAALEAIKSLKARYCYLVDYKQWDGYCDLFTRDATLNVDRAVSTRGRFGDPMPEVRGREAIRDSVASMLRDADTVHQVHMPVLELTSPTTATGIWAMEDIVRLPGFHLEGRGHYRETYVMEVERWRIATLHLTRSWLNIIEGDCQTAERLSASAI
ncbi:MAG: nuclear transport factor 2 family protein [Rhodospirillales bacterium]|nr:nuclear transport factor 2 family protein [Rhodospirillales bacterium]